MITYTLFHNQDAWFMRPGTPEDTYVMGWSGKMGEPDTGSITAVLEQIFAWHNADNRPDARLNPSLSVGDVVILAPDGLTGEPWAYTVDILGFRPW